MSRHDPELRLDATVGVELQPSLLVLENKAIRARGVGGDLSEDTRRRYYRNRRIITQVTKGLLLRNLALLQVYEEEQWREEFSTVTEFAEKYAELSSSQFYKVIDEANVYQAFAEEGMAAIRPRGRCVEELVKVKPSHRIAAWSFAMDTCKEGLSQGLVRDALRDYCRDHQLEFGRRQPNPTSLMLPAPAPESAESVPAVEDWKDHLPLSALVALRRIVAPAVLETVEKTFVTKVPEIVILDSLLSLPEPRMEPEEREAWGEVLEVLRTHAAPHYLTVVLRALSECREAIGEAALARCKKKDRAKNGSRRKAKPVPAS